MYTQCPECNLMFRVTADVLKQAAGKVRCGGCGNTFNALRYLSEDRPGKQPGRAATGAPPELEAEPGDEPANEPPPAAVSPEQSQRLLATLERLAGSDVRIEDTGIEWRIMGGDDDADGDPPPAPAAEELRFDDDTGLPEDFDLDAPVAPPPRKPEPESEPGPEPEPEPERSHGDTHVDIAFGAPEEWSALLGEVVDDSAPDDGDAVEVEGSSEDEETPDEEPQAVPPATAANDGPGDDLEQELEEMNELLDGVGPDSTGEVGFELEESQRDPEESSIDEDLFAAAFEAERRRKQDRQDERAAADDGIQLHLDADVADDDIETDGHAESLALDLEVIAGGDELSLELDAAAANDAADVDLVLDSAESDDNRVEFDEFEELEEPVEFIVADKPAEHLVPEPTEEEETINRMIDEDLLALAVEDEDGFASTIIIDEQAAQDAIDAPEMPADEFDEDREQVPDIAAFPDIPTGIGVETIVMEGESVRDALEEQALEEARQQGKEPARNPELDALKQQLKAETEADAAASGGLLTNRRMVVGLVVLGVLLLLQGIHFSRTALATMPGIGGAIEPVYRALGMPITPGWDVTGWRFEVTKGSTDPTRFTRAADTVAAGTDGDGDVLTIYSRIGNRSSQPLPYPLVSVSLTDRFEETIGNKVLEPVEYLPQDVDPDVPLAPGNTFDAIISIDSPAPEATGFRLNVCYPLASGRLRCAIEHFK